MNSLTKEQIEEITLNSRAAEGLYSTYATFDSQAIRLYDSNKPADPLRSAFAIDADRIIHNKFFNRGSDKTQVFSFYKNDDITRRASHVQLVSRIARTIGKPLRLNLDLIEAIAIGHDIGHTPFGHAGEAILSDLYYSHAGKYFNHNVHSVRILSVITHNNLTVQTLDGIICHCGEKVDEQYAPNTLPSRDEFLNTFSDCYTQKNAVKALRPATLEGCVVRLSDMIAYIGKDRQDAMYSLKLPVKFETDTLGRTNREIIENVIKDVIANSMGKPYLSLSRDVYDALEAYKKENNEKIYQIPAVRDPYDNIVKPMMQKMYERFLKDVTEQNYESPVFQHYIFDGYIIENYSPESLEKTPDDAVVDFIAGMTDDYFLDAFAQLFPNDELNDKVQIVGYFNQ